MSIYYSPELVKLLMNERLHEARERNMVHCCEEIVPVQPKSSIRGAILSPFRRQSPAECGC
jgi:hypothetical protein